MNGEERPAFTRAARAVVSAARRRLIAHPSLDELSAYRAGRVTPAVRESIRDHVSLCGECLQALLALGDRAVAAGPPGAASNSAAANATAPAEGPPPFERVWRQFLTIRAAHVNGTAADNEAPEEAEDQPGAMRRLAPPRPALLGFAAGVVFAVAIGWLWWSFAARPEITVNEPLWTLVAVRDDPSAVEHRRIPPDARQVTLVLTLLDAGDHAGYRVEVRERRGGQLVFGVGGLRWRPELGFRLDVPRELLPPGSYRVELFGIDRGRETDLAKYGLDIEPSG
jgi:hypothetical protein